MSIQVPPDSTGKVVDTASVNGAERQIAVLGDPATAAAVAKVAAATPGATDYGLVTRRAPKGLTLAAFNFNSASDQPLITAPGVGKVNKIWKLWLMVDGDTAVSIKDGATVKIGPMNMTQGGLIEWPMDEEPWFITSTNTAFVVNTSLAVQCGGIIGYTQE